MPPHRFLVLGALKVVVAPIAREAASLQEAAMLEALASACLIRYGPREEGKRLPNKVWSA